MNSKTPRWVPFAYGFRPFFLLAGVYAIVAIAAWLWLFRQNLMLLPAMPQQYWHAHEMLYGFVAAAIAGFMLTAVPSWTGSRGFAGRPLQLLVLLWLLGRVAFLFSSQLPFAVLALLELAFIPAVMLVIGPSLLRKPSRNTPLLLVLLAYWAGDVVFMLGVADARADLAATGLRAGLNLVLVLLTVIGGRIVPAFTGNALRAAGIDVRMRVNRLLETTTIALMIAYAIADIAAPWHAATGFIAAFAAVAQTWRLSGWHGWQSAMQPIVWVLHVAYLWLPIGLTLKAVQLLGGFTWAAHWAHALGAGAAGTMILAVMTRASLGHTGRPLKVHSLITVAYVSLTLSIAIRVFGPALLPLSYATTVMVSGICWLLAFGLYVAVYLPILLRPRVDGKPG